MFFDRNMPGLENTLLAFNGELIGCVIQADTEKGYVIKAKYSEERQAFYGHETLHGKVAFIGDSELDSRDVLMERLNKHRADCGLGPYPEVMDPSV